MRRRLSLICVVSLLLLFASAGFAPVPQAQTYGEVVWVDDNLPDPNATMHHDGGDSWNWVTSPKKFGTRAHQSNAVGVGEWHQHYFMNSVNNPLDVGIGDVLFAYVYLPPTNMPQQLMLQWFDGAGWEHRAYWGADILPWGVNGQPSRRSMGELPLGGQWARLVVPASAVGLEGIRVTGMAFTLVGGQATWDRAGKVTPPPPSAERVWVEDGIPDASAEAHGQGGDGWSWVSSPRFSGNLAHRSNAAAEMHQHFFLHANNNPLDVGVGDVLFAYVNMESSNRPQQLMLQWYDGIWEHRAYWGADILPWGDNAQPGRRYMGPLPAAGSWVRLEVAASEVGLEGRRVTGMAFTLVGGQATWDRAGKYGQSAPPPATPTPTPTPPPTSGPVVMTVLSDDPAARHQNFKLQTTGFSVIKAADAYHVYGSTNYQQIRWNQGNTGWDNLYHDTAVYPLGSHRPDCSFSKDPRLWAPKCSTDAMGYFWKAITCRPDEPCQDNDRWNAGGGRNNVDTYATVSITDHSPSMQHPVWPQLYNSDFPFEYSSYGVLGFNTTIDHHKVNAVDIRPAGADCHNDAETIWVDDALPFDSVRNPPASGPGWKDESWKWVYADPAPTPHPGVTVLPAVSPGTSFDPPPFPSMVSHQSEYSAGIHQHYFTNASAPLAVEAGDVMIAYIYIDPNNRPEEVMLQWLAGNNWHRAYWGADKITHWGARTKVGDRVPEADRWVRLEVPASSVGLAGKSVTGMAFTLFGGSATWDRAGKTKVLSPRPCPPKSGTTPANSQHAYNPDDYATGASNSKAVQVNYPNGTRWFMTFNKMIKKVNGTYYAANSPDPNRPAGYNESNYGRSAADNWEVMWATSTNGRDWTVHPQMLFRSAGQALEGHLGLLVTDMMIDGGYFYILMSDLWKVKTYLVRARIDPTYSTTTAGYVQNAGEGWSVASHPLHPTTNEYTWTRLPLGAQVDFDNLTQSPTCASTDTCVEAYSVMQAACVAPPGWGCAMVPQTSMARIRSTTTGESRIFGVSNDWNGVDRAATLIKLWSTPSLSKPFVLESNVQFSQPFRPGAFGWEFGFNHYPDNTIENPRILGSGFDVWFTVTEHPQQIPNQPPVPVPADRAIILERHTARLSNF